MKKQKRRGAAMKAKGGPARVAVKQDREELPAPVARPFKPRRGVFIVLLAAFVAWMVALLTLYFLRVYPGRHG